MDKRVLRFSFEMQRMHNVRRFLTDIPKVNDVILAYRN